MTTPAPLLRGLAVLALLCLLPRASAFQLILTGETIGSVSTSGGGTRAINSDWRFDRYGGSELIEDVTVRVTLTTFGFVKELNIFDTPQSWSISAGNVAGLYVDTRSQVFSAGASTPIISLAPHTSMTLPILWVQDFSIRFAGPEQVGFFVGTGQGSIVVSNLVSLMNRWGGGSATSHAQYSVIYNAADAGTTCGLLASALVVLACLNHRRRSRAPL